MKIKPFKLQLTTGEIYSHAADLQMLVDWLYDKIPKPESPGFLEAKNKYNKFANFYNTNVDDVWTIIK